MMSNVASLDYEAKPHHQLRVRATDTLNGGYSEAIVLFEVEDVRVSCYIISSSITQF